MTQDELQASHAARCLLQGCVYTDGSAACKYCGAAKPITMKDVLKGTSTVDDLMKQRSEHKDGT